MSNYMDDDEQQVAPRSVIMAGNSELDSRMGGGLPVGTLALIEGGSGSGKSVLSQQIIWGALRDGYTAAVYTSENSVKSLMTQMRSIDLDVLDFLLLSRLRVYPMELAHLGDKASQVLMRAIKQNHDRDLIVIDSFTSAVVHASTDRNIFTFFEDAKRLCAQGSTVLITLHADAVEPDLMNPIRAMCDAHLILRSDQDGQRLVKTLQVAKIRGASSVTGAIVGFEVEPGWGMRVIPISKARG